MYVNNRFAEPTRLVVPPLSGVVPIVQIPIPAGRNVLWGLFAFAGECEDGTGVLGIGGSNWFVTRNDAGVLTNPTAIGTGLLNNEALVIVDDDTVELRAENLSVADAVELVIQPTRGFVQLETVVLP
jgi:hypothetical protein